MVLALWHGLKIPAAAPSPGGSWMNAETKTPAGGGRFQREAKVVVQTPQTVRRLRFTWSWAVLRWIMAMTAATSS